MRILGIHDGHNATACLLEDGRIVAAQHEERLCRVKNWWGFPEQAIRLVLEMGGIKLGDVDIVAMNGHHMPYPKSRAETMEQYRQTSSADQQARRVLRRTIVGRLFTQKRKRERRADLRRMGVPDDRVLFVDHHDCHAAAAYHGAGIYDEDVLVLTNDGGGDGLCATVSIGRNGRLERIAEVPWTESIGNIYATVTFLMGMVPLEHEYKLMGLAPYASAERSTPVFEKLRELFEFDSQDPLVWRRRRSCPETFYSYHFLRERLELMRFDWICGGLQRFVEEMLTEWVGNAVRKTGIRRVALSGGVFMNVKANMAILELPEVDSLFVYPSCGDESNAIGAAYWAHVDVAGHESLAPLRDVYWGTDRDLEAVERTVGELTSGLTIRRPDNIEHEVARLLAAGEVVARHKGRAEFGARAIGNRSILADPSRLAAVRTINDMIKSRDFWMPFAPSIMEEYANKYVVNPKEAFAPYMILALNSTENSDQIVGATHPYDHTVRPQVVRKSWNSSYHALLSEFHRLTGIGAVLNTSFNLHGLPIVESPADSIDVLCRSGLRHLALGDVLISKGGAASA